MKKIAIIKKKEVAIGLLAVFFLLVGFFSYNPIFKQPTTQVSDVENHPETTLGEATLVSSNDIEESENTIENIVETVAQKDYFQEAKMERDNTYSKSLEVYEKILENSSIASDQKLIAQNEITKITSEKMTISTVENLIKLKGFENVVIYKNGEEVSVIVRSDVLKPEQVAQIQNIVEREFKIDGKNINITCK